MFQHLDLSWTDAGSADTTQGISYSFALVPEPASLSALLLARLPID